MAAQPETQVRADISQQETGGAELAELTHVHQFMGHQSGLIGGPFSNDDGATQRDGVGLWWHRPAPHDAVSPTLLDSHGATLPSRIVRRRQTVRPNQLRTTRTSSEQPHRELFAVVGGSRVLGAHDLEEVDELLTGVLVGLDPLE